MDGKHTTLGELLEAISSPPKNLSTLVNNQRQLPDYSSMIKMEKLVPIENPMIKQLADINIELKKANEKQEIELKNRATELEDSKIELKKQKRINWIMVGFTVLLFILTLGMFIIMLIQMNATVS